MPNSMNWGGTTPFSDRRFSDRRFSDRRYSEKIIFPSKALEML